MRNAIARSGGVAAVGAATGGGAIQQCVGHPGLPVRWRSAHQRLRAIEGASSTEAAWSRVAAGAPPPGGAGRACAAASPLSVALSSARSWLRAASAHLRVAGNASSCGAVGPCSEQNTRSVVGRVCAQVVPLFARPNPSIERTAKGLRPSSAAHVER
jgi:hypothetical protein